MSNSGGDLRDMIRDDDRRRREEIRVAALQTQLDEMRSLVRELTQRQTRNEDHFKNYEAGLAELRAQLDQHRHEVTQSTQARQLDDTRIRDQLSELDARIDEMNRPIRALQSHVAEALEQIRRGRDEDQDDLRRFQELRTLIDNVAALSERNADNMRALRDSIEDLRTGQAQIEREVVKVDDAIRITEQDSRRRDADVELKIQTLEERLAEIKPIFDQHYALIEDLRDSVKHFDPAIEALRSADESLEHEITRIYEQAIERDEVQSERVDEVRVQLDAGLRDLRQTITENYERLSERIDDLGDRLRELGYQISVIDMRLDELGDSDIRIRRELWHLHEMRTRMRLDQIQEELESVVSDRREVESQLAGERSPRTTANGGVD